MQSNFFENHSVSSNAQTPGLPAASTGQVITKEVAFYEKVGELMDTSPELYQLYFAQKI